MDEIKEWIAYPKLGAGFLVFFIQAKDRKQAMEILKARIPNNYKYWYMVSWSNGTVEHLNKDYLR